MPTITERDFNSEYLFRSCSVTTGMVTSPKFQPIRCATMLCQFGRTRNGYVATRFILLSSTAMSSPTGDHITVPERFGQDEEPASRSEERIRKKPSSVPKSKLKKCRFMSDM